MNWPCRGSSVTVLARLNHRTIQINRPMRGSKENVFPWGVRFEGLKLTSGARWGVACGGKKSLEPSGGSENPRVEPDIARSA